MNTTIRYGMQFCKSTDTKFFENTYEAGKEVARNDIIRFGTLHAMDKLSYLDEGPFADGYADQIAQLR